MAHSHSYGTVALMSELNIVFKILNFQLKQEKLKQNTQLLAWEQTPGNVA